MTKPPTVKNIDLLKKRIDFYAEVSKQSDVFIEIFQILEHPSLSGQYFIHLKYIIESIVNGVKNYSKHEELETFSTDMGWIAFLNQSEEIKLATFIKSAKKVSINVDNVKLK